MLMVMHGLKGENAKIMLPEYTDTILLEEAR